MASLGAQRWYHCPLCKGRGWNTSGGCWPCGGSGWIFVKWILVPDKDKST